MAQDNSSHDELRSLIEKIQNHMSGYFYNERKGRRAKKTSLHG
jgi:hypothetical protein